jgi:hypothetical protein
VAAHLTFLVLCGLRHISTENFALGSLRSDDWQIGRPASHFRIELGTKRNAVQLSFVP